MSSAYDIRVTVEKSEEFTSKLVEKFKEWDVQALVAYEYGVEGGHGHYQGCIIGTVKPQKIRDWFRKTVELSRTQYKVGELKKTLDDLLRYICKGDGDYHKFCKGGMPVIVINTEGWDVKSLYERFWEMNVDYSKQVAEGMTIREQIKRKADAMGIDYKSVHAKDALIECTVEVKIENAKKGRSIQNFHYDGAFRSVWLAECHSAKADDISMMRDRMNR